MPASTSRTPSSSFAGVSRLMRPSSSSSPQSPHVEPGGRCFHRLVTSLLLQDSATPGIRCTDRLVYQFRGIRMTEKDFVVSADGHVLEPTDLFRTRLPRHLRDRGVWEEDFEIEPFVEGGARIFRRLHTPGYEGWTISRYRQTGGRMPEGGPEVILEDMA